MHISDNIKRIRKLKNLSQKRVALDIGVAQGQYSIIESGKTTPTIPTLNKIADVLEVRITEFFKDPNENEDDINLSILEKVKLIDQLDDDEKNNLLGIIDMAISKKKLKDNLSNLLAQ